jgi:DNA-binding transcriptional ArsR family regulator
MEPHERDACRPGYGSNRRYDHFIMSSTPGQRPLYEIKAGLFKGLSHPLRIRILELLSASPERSVAELQSETGLEASHLSQHLAVLRRNRLVESDRRASSVYYRLAYPEVAELLTVARRLLLHVVAADAGRAVDVAALPPLGPRT